MKLRRRLVMSSDGNVIDISTDDNVSLCKKKKKLRPTKKSHTGQSTSVVPRSEEIKITRQLFVDRDVMNSIKKYERIRETI